MTQDPKVVVCMYTAKEGKEAELEALLRQHWPTLHRLGLATDTPGQLLRGLASEPGTHAADGKYMEIFSWKDENSMHGAHNSPEVMAIWEAIGTCASFMDFPGYERFE